MTRRLLLSIAALAALSACAGTAKKDAPKGPDAPAAAKMPDYSKSPVQVGTGVIVAATPAQVWGILADLDQWGAWNPKVTKVTAQPGLNVGTEIAYSWEEREIKAVVEELKENEVLLWRGTRTASDAKLRWILQPVPGGTSLNLFAILKPGAGATPQANAFNELNAWLEPLKAEAEKRFPAPAPAPKSKPKAVKKAAPKPISKP